ncbi:hypothetical protein MPSEU_000399100 [Mayamaea pseudoterrestris]|nr:hypothetical protein MPSEU_000399100 [Mayamaea pseudoterrestris]
MRMRLVNGVFDRLWRSCGCGSDMRESTYAAQEKSNFIGLAPTYSNSIESSDISKGSSSSSSSNYSTDSGSTITGPMAPDEMLWNEGMYENGSFDGKVYPRNVVILPTAVKCSVTNENNRLVSKSYSQSRLAVASVPRDSLRTGDDDDDDDIPDVTASATALILGAIDNQDASSKSATEKSDNLVGSDVESEPFDVQQQTVNQANIETSTLNGAEQKLNVGEQSSHAKHKRSALEPEGLVACPNVRSADSAVSTMSDDAGSHVAIKAAATDETMHIGQLLALLSKSLNETELSAMVNADAAEDRIAHEMAGMDEIMNIDQLHLRAPVAVKEIAGKDDANSNVAAINAGSLPVVHDGSLSSTACDTSQLEHREPKQALLRSDVWRVVSDESHWEDLQNEQRESMQEHAEKDDEVRDSHDICLTDSELTDEAIESLAARSFVASQNLKELDGLTKPEHIAHKHQAPQAKEPCAATHKESACTTAENDSRLEKIVKLTRTYLQNMQAEMDSVPFDELMLPPKQPVSLLNSIDEAVLNAEALLTKINLAVAALQIKESVGQTDRLDGPSSKPSAINSVLPIGSRPRCHANHLRTGSVKRRSFPYEIVSEAPIQNRVKPSEIGCLVQDRVPESIAINFFEMEEEITFQVASYELSDIDSKIDECAMNVDDSADGRTMRSELSIVETSSKSANNDAVPASNEETTSKLPNQSNSKILSAAIPTPTGSTINDSHIKASTIDSLSGTNQHVSTKDDLFDTKYAEETSVVGSDDGLRAIEDEMSRLAVCNMDASSNTPDHGDLTAADADIETPIADDCDSTNDDTGDRPRVECAIKSDHAFISKVPIAYSNVNMDGSKCIKACAASILVPSSSGDEEHELACYNKDTPTPLVSETCLTPPPDISASTCTEMGEHSDGKDCTDSSINLDSGEPSDESKQASQELHSSIAASCSDLTGPGDSDSASQFEHNTPARKLEIIIPDATDCNTYDPDPVLSCRGQEAALSFASNLSSDETICEEAPIIAPPAPSPTPKLETYSFIQGFWRNLEQVISPHSQAAAAATPQPKQSVRAVAVACRASTFIAPVTKR